MSRFLFRLTQCAVVAAASLAALPALAQEFGVYLNCKGEATASGSSSSKPLPSNLDVALRRNSQLALLQSSNILPAGAKMRLEITPQFYTMTYKAPIRGTVIYNDWLRGALLVWNPDLKKLQTIRMSVDRQSAALQGEMLDGEGAVMGKLAMRCDPKNNDTVAEPKF
jgi:hypothetical protein